MRLSSTYGLFFYSRFNVSLHVKIKSKSRNYIYIHDFYYCFLFGSLGDEKCFDRAASLRRALRASFEKKILSDEMQQIRTMSYMH